MYTKKIWYSVVNCGDGSAFPQLMESQELAEWHQAHMTERWGEDCSGYIEVQSVSPITLSDKVTTIDDIIDDMGWDLEHGSSRQKEELKQQIEELRRLHE